jgi:2-oxoisovalerate dehydrogenase E1 component
MGTSGIVGPSILLAAGAAYTYKLLKSDRVAVAFFGDGAVSNGAFHEGLNLASVWKLPALFVCENNLYATEVPFAKATANPSVASRASAYGLRGVELDGNDVLAIYRAAGEAVRAARAGEGPTLLECKTYRTRPHSEGMRDSGYRTREEIESWRTRDPIDLLQNKLLGEGLASAAELQQIDAEISAQAVEAHVYAQNSPWPDPSTVAEHVYSSCNPE